MKFTTKYTWVLLFGALLTVGAPAVVVAQTAVASQTRCDKFLSGFGLSSPGTAVTNSNNNGANIITNQNLPRFCTATDLILFVIKYLAMMSGLVTVVFIIVGGFMYVTSAGNEEQAEKGRKILVNSLIGLVVVIMAYSIVVILSGLLQGSA